MKGKRKLKPITLWGRAVHYTEKAVKWHDTATGYELWFPLSVSEIKGDTITVPERMYKDGIRKWEQDEREDERINAREDRKDAEQLRRDLKTIDKQFGPEKPAGCLGVIVVAVAGAIFLMAVGH